MNKEELMKIARSLGAFEAVTRGGTSVFEFTPMLLKWFAEELLERAAQECDKIEDVYWHGDGARSANSCAECIRAMKGE